MKELFKRIKNEWMKPVREAQIKQGEPSPIEFNDSPTLVHRDCGMRYYHMSLEEVNERKDAIQSHELTDEERMILITDALGDEGFLWIQAVISYGLQDKIFDVISEILRSNKTKLTKGDLLLSDIGKVLKPDSYEKPDLGKILF